MSLQNVSDKISVSAENEADFCRSEGMSCWGAIVHWNNLFEKDPNYNLERTQAKSSYWRGFMI